MSLCDVTFEQQNLNSEKMKINTRYQVKIFVDSIMDIIIWLYYKNNGALYEVTVEVPLSWQLETV